MDYASSRISSCFHGDGISCFPKDLFGFLRACSECDSDCIFNFFLLEWLKHSILGRVSLLVKLDSITLSGLCLLWHNCQLTVHELHSKRRSVAESELCIPEE